MKDKKNLKLLVSKAEASEKINDRINIGKEMLETSVYSEDELNNLEHKTEKWTDYNIRLFEKLFVESPLSSFIHGHKMVRSVYREDKVYNGTEEHKGYLTGWINDLESIYEQLELYEESEKNTQQTLNTDTINNENKKIFIGHGHSHIWRELKDFIVDTLGLKHEEFERISAAGKSINNRLEEMLDKSCMAFLIMTGEDEHLDYSLHARQNVIHEIGRCQDRFGSERAIILLEEGCKKFSNIDNVVYIPFTKGNIKETFGEVVRVLKRESIIRIELCN